MLTKLTILPFEHSETFQIEKPAGPPFEVQFNPESYTDETKIELAPTEPAHGDVGQEAKFKSIQPKTYAFKLMMDGTGYSEGYEGKNSVTEQLEAFRKTTGFSGNTHRPRFLMLVWGKLSAVCVLESFTITYTLFASDGLPLRATVDATFKEHKDPKTSEREKNLSSPDIDHVRVALAGDRLPSMVFDVYRSTRYTVDVARANGLDTIRRVDEGRAVVLPPLGG
ncbi:hypothetical protein DKT77_19120 [Meridianimarinicoccus roseus]|jgi:hypothetical protein|uniref:Contractile injection system tube protein N-terminal domain-containing protein n=1 Tax=Meridianimarinicoccus roseus TaxID=2072018 RepID=A0A2V2LBZ2_9RHOB|nr:hypothetical protein [Meridianimarinicoccus roseus]PWR01044.1 hypothetical protein DKT77_19120 [Meridianimarinicoccus roseus]